MKIFLSLCLLFCFCIKSYAQTDSALINISANDSTYPNVSASTSTQPLMMIMACRILNMPYIWDDNKTQSFVVVHPDVPIERQHNLHTKNHTPGTNEAYSSLIRSSSDIILVARLPSIDEYREASSKGAAFDYKPIAIDAFVFLVHSSNPVQSLTMEQIRDIYTGKTINWSEVNGAGALINAYTRQRNSGSEELMEKLVMNGLPIIKGESMEVKTMRGPFNAISNDSLGIGYSVYFYENYIANTPDIKRIAVDGLYPDYETLRSRTYPLTADVYAVIRTGTDTNSVAYKMYEWITSEEGQNIVKESKYVPIN